MSSRLLASLNTSTENRAERGKQRQAKTKGELAEIRKQWMKTRFKVRADPSNPLSVEKQAHSASAIKSSQAGSAKKAFSSKMSKTACS